MIDQSFKYGFYKAAQEENMEQTSPPESDQEDQTTAVTCVSDCQYSQNPEKRCMLDSVSLTQDNDGTFICGQYTPMQEPMEDMSQGTIPNGGQNGINNQGN